MAELETARRAKCYAFYSYKGGSGRSTTCVNTILHLIKELKADPEHPILLVDSDLESAGLTYFFDCEKTFSSLSVNTTMLLSEKTDQLTPDNEQWVLLGDESCYPSRKISKIVIDSLEALGEKNAYELLHDITVYAPEDKVLSGIVESYVKCRKSEQDDPEAVFSQDEPTENDVIIYKTYNIGRLLAKLENVQRKKEEISEEMLLAQKRSALLEFLPATHFVDISGFFNCEEGTVRFLGVVLNYQGEQLLRNNADRMIGDFIKTCGKAGYRAVVFDSSAGVQSSAHALHEVADVIVYCLRPSQQFIKGTAMQLDNYRSALRRHKEKLEIERAHYEGEAVSAKNKKPIILLPTVVPKNDRYAALRDDSFEDIRTKLLPQANRELIDDTFCTPQTALGEVEYFKWREQILGVPDGHHRFGKTNSMAAQFSDENKVLSQEDTAGAYRTYQALAKRLVKNS